MPEGTKIPIVHILAPSIAQQDIKKVTREDESNGQDLEAFKDLSLESQDLQVDQGSWITPVIKYFQHGKIPDGENQKSFRIRVTPYSLINNILYKRSLAGPYLRCLQQSQALEVLKDIHKGDCGNHTGGRSLVSKILKTGYFWPNSFLFGLWNRSDDPYRDGYSNCKNQFQRS